MVPIPIGVRRIAVAQGTVWKVVPCGHCKQEYAYQLQLEATGDDVDLLFLDAEDSARRAQARAEQNLSKMAENVVVPVPCPQCGFYQDDMVAMLRTERESSVPLIVGLAIAGLSLVPLLFPVPYLWIATVAGVLVGFSVMAYGDVAASRFDPNAGDPEPRKARGRRVAVWGEQLKQLLPASADTAVPGAAVSGGGWELIEELLARSLSAENVTTQKPPGPGPSNHNIKPE